jgi:hypothetical protein
MVPVVVSGDVSFGPMPEIASISSGVIPKSVTGMSVPVISTVVSGDAPVVGDAPPPVVSVIPASVPGPVVPTGDPEASSAPVAPGSSAPPPDVGTPVVIGSPSVVVTGLLPVDVTSPDGVLSKKARISSRGSSGLMS